MGSPVGTATPLTDSLVNRRELGRSHLGRPAGDRDGDGATRQRAIGAAVRGRSPSRLLRDAVRARAKWWCGRCAPPSASSELGSSVDTSRPSNTRTLTLDGFFTTWGGGSGTVRAEPRASNIRNRATHTAVAMQHAPRKKATVPTTRVRVMPAGAVRGYAAGRPMAPHARPRAHQQSLQRQQPLPAPHTHLIGQTSCTHRS